MASHWLIVAKKIHQTFILRTRESIEEGDIIRLFVGYRIPLGNGKRGCVSAKGSRPMGIAEDLRFAVTPIGSTRWNVDVSRHPNRISQG